MDLCERTVRRPGAWVYQRWWDQEGIYLAGTREWAAQKMGRKRGGEKRGLMRIRQTETEGRIYTVVHITQ